MIKNKCENVFDIEKNVALTYIEISLWLTEISKLEKMDSNVVAIEIGFQIDQILFILTEFIRRLKSLQLNGQYDRRLLQWRDPLVIFGHGATKPN